MRECLVRDPKQRLRDIGDARITIERVLSGGSDQGDEAVPATATVTPRPLWRRAIPVVLAAIVIYERACRLIN